MPSQLQVSLLAANFESDGMTSHKHGLAATETVLKWRLAYFETNFFRIARTSEAEISVNGKADCSLVEGEDKKVKIFGVTFSFKFKPCA